jgi:hypothetical protein
MRMKRLRRKTNPGVVGGKVRKKNRTDPSATYEDTPQPKARRSRAASSSSSATVLTREIRPPFFHDDSAVRTNSGKVRGSPSRPGRP